MPKLALWLVERHHKKRRRYQSGKFYSLDSRNIDDIYGESVGRPNEQMVLEVANKELREILKEETDRGRIDQVDFETELYAPYCPEDRQGKDLRITFFLPERLHDQSIFVQVKSSKEGARNFREKFGDRIPVVVARKNKDPNKDRLRIARFLAGLIRQELKKENNCEASL
jgi:hypothetical protein